MNLKKIAVIFVGVLFCSIAFWLSYAHFYKPVPTIDTTPLHPDPAWNSGQVVHILPTVNPNRFLIKIFFDQPLTQSPYIDADKRIFVGTKTDTEGYFWMFDLPGLNPDTSYKLTLKTASGKLLCDPWPLKTFPAPGDKPEKLRVMVYTCFGGHDAHIKWYGSGPVPLPIRHSLLKRGLSFNPDAIISTGDQIYYDLLHGRTSKYLGGSIESTKYSGKFDRSKPVLGTANESVLKKAAGPKIASLYGTALKSAPIFFLLDD